MSIKENVRNSLQSPSPWHKEYAGKGGGTPVTHKMKTLYVWKQLMKLIREKPAVVV